MRKESTRKGAEKVDDHNERGSIAKYCPGAQPRDRELKGGRLYDRDGVTATESVLQVHAKGPSSWFI